MDLKATTRQVLQSVDRNSPTILTGVAVLGVITTVVLAIRATPKAQMLIEAEKIFREEEYGDNREMTPVDIAQATWKCYIPTVGMGVLTIGCIIGANHINLRRNAALASLYSLSVKTLEEYQKKVVEQIGEKKEEKIRDEIAQDEITRNPPKAETIVLTGKGTYLCYDKFSGRYFRSDIETVRRAENKFNQMLLREMWLSINEFYDLIRLEPTEFGEEQGWIAERNMMDLKFHTKLATLEDGREEPCLVIDYYVQPHHI